MSKLTHSTSPYLQRHATNPVQWRLWEPATFQDARKQNKPIFLSVGYFTCFWCHVMEQDVFMDKDVAEFLNTHYIPIKVDREKLPDVDETYMVARELITQRTGWPNNVFLTPNGEPFLALGVLTKDKRYGASFVEVIQQVAKNWNEKNADIIDAAKQIRALVDDRFSGKLPDGGAPDKTIVDRFYAYLQTNYDSEFGGFYGNPKFPHESYLAFLLADYQDRKDEFALEMVAQTIKKMAAGGIFDHVGGGFHRYTTDREWQQPHFEKMLYSQALQARVFTQLYGIRGKTYHRDIAESTLDFVLHDMMSPDGAFYAAIDAETDGVEGAYYVWNEKEIAALLTEQELKLFAECYALAEMEIEPGHPPANGGILHARQHLIALANEKNRSYESLRDQLQPIFKKLFEARQQRKSPDIDRKIITGWNALMIESLALASKEFEREDYLQAAIKATQFVLTEPRVDERYLARIWMDGKVGQHAYLEDYAYLESACLTLFEITQDRQWLDHAKSLQTKADILFWDEKSGGYYFNDGTDEIITRIRRGYDGALPSCTGVMLLNLLRLHEDDRNEIWLNRAKLMMSTYREAMERNPADFSTMIQGMLYLYR